MPTDANGYAYAHYYALRLDNVNSYSWTQSVLSSYDTVTSLPDSLNYVVAKVKFKIGVNITRVIKLTATNGCGSVTPSLSIGRNLPSFAAWILQYNLGDSSGYKRYKYRLSLRNPYANYYTWLIPAGGTIYSGQGTDMIFVRYLGAINGVVSVKAYNACGSGLGSSIPVNISRIFNVPDSNIHQQITFPITENHLSDEIKIFPLPSTTSFHVQVNTALDERIQLKVTDLQGRVLITTSVKPGELKELGKELIPGYYILTIHQAGIITSRKLLKL
jgi:hypothetical protein